MYALNVIQMKTVALFRVNHTVTLMGYVLHVINQNIAPLPNIVDKQRMVGEMMSVVLMTIPSVVHVHQCLPIVLLQHHMVFSLKVAIHIIPICLHLIFVRH